MCISNNIEVLFFIPSFEDGGVERSTIAISNYFVSQGYSVSLFCVRISSKQISDLDDRVKVLNNNFFLSPRLYSNFPLFFMHPRLIDCVNILIPFLKKIYQNKKNIVVLSVQNSVFSIILSRVIGVKIIARSANHPVSSLKYADNKVFTKVVGFIKKYIYRKASAVVANSHLFAEELSIYLNTSVTAIYNPTLNIKKINQKKNQFINHKWIKSEGLFTLISVGRLSKQKDYPTLLKAISILNDESIRLIIAGDGKLKEELIALSKKLGVDKQIDFLGHLENPYALVYKADLFVLSSVYEGLPNALLEAVAVGTPAISTDCLSGPREILLDGDGGSLVPVGNSQRLADGISQIKNNYVEAIAKAEKAKKNSARFTPEIAGQDYLELVEKVWKS